MSTTPSNSNPQNSLPDNDELQWLTDLKRTGELYSDISVQVMETQKRLDKLKRIKEFYEERLIDLFKPLEEDWEEEEALRDFVRNYRSSS